MRWALKLCVVLRLGPALLGRGLHSAAVAGASLPRAGLAPWVSLCALRGSSAEAACRQCPLTAALVSRSVSGYGESCDCVLFIGFGPRSAGPWNLVGRARPWAAHGPCWHGCIACLLGLILACSLPLPSSHGQ